MGSDGVVEFLDQLSSRFHMRSENGRDTLAEGLFPAGCNVPNERSCEGFVEVVNSGSVEEWPSITGADGSIGAPVIAIPFAGGLRSCSGGTFDSSI